MTLKEQDDFADKVATKVLAGIKELQGELDSEFFEEVEKMDKGYEISAKAADIASLVEEREKLLHQLNDSLREAIDAQNYRLAGKIKKEIENLKK